MQEPRGLPPAPSGSGLRSALRWLASACLGVAVTAVLFTAVLGIRIEENLVDRLLRLFPLRQVALSDEDRCALASPRLDEAISIEGSVGTLVGDRFVSIGDAEVLGERLTAAGRWMAVEPDGRFRFVTALPGEDPEACAASDEEERVPASTPQLVIRAPGCTPRRVPVIRPWIPRRILLTCDARG